MEESGSSDLFYPASNYIAAELALHAGERGWRGIEPTLMTRIRENLVQQNRQSPEFWSIVGEIELDFYEAVGEGKLAADGSVAREALRRSVQSDARRDRVGIGARHGRVS